MTFSDTSATSMTGADPSSVPNVIVPRHSRLTRSPPRPSRRCSTSWGRRAPTSGLSVVRRSERRHYDGCTCVRACSSRRLRSNQNVPNGTTEATNPTAARDTGHFASSIA